MTTPASILARLDANVAAFYADAVTFKTFGLRNRAIWAEAQAVPGVAVEVERMLRERV